MKTFAAALTLVFLSTSTLLAGPPNPTKNNQGSLRITNNSNSMAAILLNPSQNTLNTIANSPNLTQQQFLGLGGRILNAAGGQAGGGIDGPTITIGNLSAAQTHTLYAALIIDPNQPPPVNNAQQRNYNVTAGGTTQATISGNANPPTLASLLPAQLGRETLFASLSLAGVGALSMIGIFLSRRGK